MIIKADCKGTSKAPVKLLEVSENGRAIGWCNITHMTEDQIKALIALQDGMGRTWNYKTLKPYKYPDLDRGEE